jgi:DNA helicase-2/ATP-dependent DNA helicase PcrA
MSQFPLNPAQREAIEHHTGPLLVLAGAGSGKTRVITERIARLIERGVPASAILALTFTNKAAGEMAERVAKILGKKAASGATISTFHSFGLRVLEREKKALGGTFTIFDQGDCLALVKELLGRIDPARLLSSSAPRSVPRVARAASDAGRRFDAAAVAARISNAKNAFTAPEDFVPREGDEYDEVTQIVYPRYQAALRSFRAFDFDDLVCEVARIWSQRPDVLERWQKTYRYILVDEYQDTNRAQLELLRLLAAEHKNICVVGDDDQAIYAWRGADVRNILEFEDQFAGTRVVKLEQNYRSRAPILAVANAVIAKRTDARHKKVLFTDKPGGDKPLVVVAETPEAEAAWVAREARRQIQEERRRAREIAILYRSNGQAKLLEEALREQGVPHRVVGGQQFFERKEVKDVLAYLKLALNPHDEISLRRVINYPARGIGETSIERLTQHALAKDWTLMQAVERVAAIDGIPDVARSGCAALESILTETRERLLAPGTKPAEAARALCERVGLRREIDASSPTPQAAARRWGNVESLFVTLSRHDHVGKTETARRQAIARLLHSLTLDFGDDDDEAEPGDVVTLSTLHGSKGLEFDVVFFIGVEEGYLPHLRTLETRATEATSQDVEEERRLFYVGVTRAREKLFLSRAKFRAMRGKAVPRTPSRFLMEVPAELVDEIEVKGPAAMSLDEMSASANRLLAALEGLG